MLNIQAEILSILDEILSLQGRSAAMTPETPLLGAVPELDSMAVVGVIGAIEERFGIFFDDDEIDGQTFATVGSLIEAVGLKIAA
ncbi:acyl carrier protein [Thauera butanivorans]|uniref:acyl carrier protein n=1 Tax=Thauera butanivorans TaxID=86174 RepID=UPI0008380793